MRKSSVINPTTTFDSNEWDAYSIDTCSDLGSHTLLSTSNFTALQKSIIYPNPSSNGNFTITSTIALDRISIYNISGQLVQDINSPSKVSYDTYTISSLTTGFYFIQLESETSKVIKKVIVN